MAVQISGIVGSNSETGLVVHSMSNGGWEAQEEWTRVRRVHSCLFRVMAVSVEV